MFGTTGSAPPFGATITQSPFSLAPVFLKLNELQPLVCIQRMEHCVQEMADTWEWSGNGQKKSDGVELRCKVLILMAGTERYIRTDYDILQIA